jgi:hypothetical protein
MKKNRVADRITVKVACIIWIVLWIPMSFLFPTHAHFPLGGVLAPPTSFFLPFDGNSAHSSFAFDWKYTYFPAVCFWGLGAIFVVLSQKLFRRK